MLATTYRYVGIYVYMEGVDVTLPHCLNEKNDHFLIILI